MIVEWNDRALASAERQPETSQSARGDTRTKLLPRSWEWSIDISSIFLLCLKLSHHNSSFLSNELNLVRLFCPYVYPPNFCSALTTSHRSCPTNAVSLDCSVHRYPLHISALPYLTTGHHSCPTNSVSLDCSVHRYPLHIKFSALSYLTTDHHSCSTNSVSLDCSVRGHLLHIYALSYLTTSHRSCPTNSVSLDCSVQTHPLHIKFSALSYLTTSHHSCPTNSVSFDCP